MKAHSAMIKTTRNDDSEPSCEPETGEQPLVETPNVNAPEEPTLEGRKKEASKPLFLIRYE